MSIIRKLYRNFKKYKGSNAISNPYRTNRTPSYSIGKIASTTKSNKLILTEKVGR